jgi:PKD repeat protein
MKKILTALILLLTIQSYACDRSEFSVACFTVNPDGSTTYQLDILIELGGFNVFKGFVLEFNSPDSNAIILPNGFDPSLTTSDLDSGILEPITGLTGSAINSIVLEAAWNKYMNRTDILSYEYDGLTYAATDDLSFSLEVTVMGRVDSIFIDADVHINNIQCIYTAIPEVECLLQPCSIAAEFSSTSIGNGTYSFTNLSSVNAAAFYWAFGDGTTSNLANPTHTFAADGNYVVTLVAADSTTAFSNGLCSDFYIASIFVSGVVNPLACHAGFVIYPDTSANNVTVVNSSSGSNLSYLWEFGDGDTSILATPSHPYLLDSIYNLCLTVDDGNGCVVTSCDSITSNGVNLKKAGFTINVISASVITSTITAPESLNLTFYPNPTKGVVNVTLTDFKQEKLTFKVVNVKGQEVAKGAVLSPNFTIDLFNETNGIYFLNVIGTTINENHKIVKY